MGMKWVTPGVMTLVWLTELGTANAQVVRDPYLIGANPAAGQYANNTSLASQASVTVPGFTNTLGGIPTSQFQSTSVGLVYSALGVTSADSGKVTYNNAPLDNTNRSTARNLAAGAVPASSTYWLGYLLNRGAISGTLPTGRDFVGVGYGNATFPQLGVANLAGLYAGFTGNNGSLALRYNSTGGAVVDTILIDAANQNIDNTTLLVVAQININVSGTTDDVTWWVNPTDFTSVASLTATALATGTFSGNPVTNAGSFARLNYASRNWNTNVFFDDPRLGTTLSGTFPVASVAPEPGSLTLLALGGAFFLRRRRK
jgi:hypothetical protein